MVSFGCNDWRSTLHCLRTKFQNVLRILSTALVTFLLIGCGSDVTEFEPDPGYVKVEYAAWTYFGHPAELTVSYYVCGDVFNTDTTFTGTHWSFEFQAQSGDSLLVGCRAAQSTYVSTSIRVSDILVAQEDGINPVVRYIIP